VNKDKSLRNRGFVFAAAAMAATSFLAATAWAAQNAGTKPAPQDDAANRSIRRDPPVNRGNGNAPANNRNIQSGNSTPASKHVGSNPVIKQRPSSEGMKLVQSKPTTNQSATVPVTTMRLADVDKDKTGKGNRENKDAGTKQPINRGPGPDTHKDTGSSGKNVITERKGPPPPLDKKSSVEGVKKAGKGPLPSADKKSFVEGAKNRKLPPSSGNKASIDDVRKRFDAQKTRKLPPGKQGVVDAGKHPPMPSKGQRNVFDERMKAGDFKRLTAGDTAKKLQLADQYRMYRAGDVARRMQLERHGAHSVMYHGVVSPLYKQHCMSYHYWGPAFFAGVCFYPHWSPWVDWSWHHHCRPYWDPRPIWCQPVIYQPCPVWVYWQTPTWTPLPEVSCGTWVDLKPVEIPAADTDLQLVAVRFVDPGHPEEKLGPRYRVWFRNNGSQPITQPFSVMLLAGNDQRMAEGMTQAGVQVTAVEPGAIQSVDIRLPVDVLAMGRDAKGQPTPFSVLHAIVDANQEIMETTRDNNGARLTPAEILPVDPATFELKPTAARAGEEVLLAGEGFGPQPGRVLVLVNGQELDGEILGWYDLGVQWTLPKLAINGPTEADVVVVRGDGAAANPVKITIKP
jgi:hypothetical protein